MIKIALLGLGTIGLATYKLIHEKFPNVEIKYILEKDLSKKKLIPETITTDYEMILNDPEVSVVIEMLGGFDFAYNCVLKALLCKKNVITSNKEIVAAKMLELLTVAKQNNVYFLFEASVGGGIPIVNYLAFNQRVNDIVSISGIINGTTNYILTKMEKEHKSFKDALHDAQVNGFAEANPEADIEGYDLVRKISILAMLGYQTEINPTQIYRYGLSNISSDFISFSTNLNLIIKYLAVANLSENRVNIRVEPVAISASKLCAHVENENNLICVDGQVGHQQMFYGLGAGGMPTAMAVVEDLLIVIENRGKVNYDNKNNFNLDHVAIKESRYIVKNKDGKIYITNLIKAIELDQMRGQILFYARIEE